MPFKVMESFSKSLCENRSFSQGSCRSGRIMYSSDQKANRKLSDRLLAAAVLLGVIGASLCLFDQGAHSVQVQAYTARATPVRQSTSLGAKRKTAVILTRFTPQLGEKGEVIYVSPGYFRNFLLPTKQALLATPEKLADIRRRQEEEAAQALEQLNQARKLATSFSVLGKFVVRRQAGPDQKIFGSVTEQDVADVIQQQMGQKIDKKNIILPEISELGTYPAEVILHPEVRGRFNVVVSKATGK